MIDYYRFVYVKKFVTLTFCPKFITPSSWVYLIGPTSNQRKKKNLTKKKLVLHLTFY